MDGECESEGRAGQQRHAQGSAGHQLGVPRVARRRPVLHGAGGAQNRLKKITGGYEEYQPNGLKRTYEDTGGLLTGWTGQAGTWTVNRKDGDTRIESIVDPAGRRTTLSYDAVGSPRLSAIIDSAGRQTLFEYDTSSDYRRRLLRVTSPEQCLTSFSYYDDDRLKEWRTPSGLITTFTYGTGPLSGQLTGIQRPDGRVTITYAGNTMEIQDARAIGRRT